MIHYCENKYCGRPFARLTKNTKYCPKCRASGLAYYKRKEEEEKVCPVCTSKFKTNLSSKIYCSAECRGKADKRKQPMVRKTCKRPGCTMTFLTASKAKKYCSRTCYRIMKANRSKNNEAS